MKFPKSRSSKRQVASKAWIIYKLGEQLQVNIYIYKMLMLDHNNHDAFIKIPFNYHFMLSKTIWKYMPKN